MRGRALAVLLLLLALTAPVSGAEESAAYGAEELFQAAEDYGVSRSDGLSGGIAGVLRRAAETLVPLIREMAPAGARLVAVALLCALAQGMVPEGDKGAMQAVELAGALSVTALAVGDVGAMIGLGRQTVEVMDGFSSLLLPVLAALTAATGQVGAAAVRQGATVLFADLLMSAMDGLLIPLIYTYVGACCACAAVGSPGLKKVAELIRGGVQGALTVFLLLFVGWLTASGAVAGSADAAAVKTAKMAISRAVPVVGGILSDAAETVLAGAGVLRGTVGAVGLAATLAICLIPFLRLALHYLTYKLAAALAGMVCDMRSCKLMDDIGSAFGLILGMTGACALLLLVSLIAAVAAAVP